MRICYLQLPLTDHSLKKEKKRKKSEYVWCSGGGGGGAGSVKPFVFLPAMYSGGK